MTVRGCLLLSSFLGLRPCSLSLMRVVHEINARPLTMTHAHTLSHIFEQWHTHPLTHLLSMTHSQAHTCTQSHTSSITDKLRSTHSPTFSNIDKITNTLAPHSPIHTSILIMTHTYSHTNSHSHSHALMQLQTQTPHTHTHAHTYTHTRTNLISPKHTFASHISFQATETHPLTPKVEPRAPYCPLPLAPASPRPPSTSPRSKKTPGTRFRSVSVRPPLEKLLVFGRGLGFGFGCCKR